MLHFLSGSVALSIRAALLLWRSMEILVVCPANCATGGPEALHEFASELNKVSGVHARLWYWDIKSDPPTPEEYRSYGCEYVTEMPAGFTGAIVVPEIWANRILEYTGCARAIYWLGLDAYAGWTPAAERGAFLEDEKILHIAQSEYAYDFLKKLKVKRLIRCTDTLNDDFYEEFEEQERKDVVLYNPAKATQFQYRLMSECSGIEFKPITGMTRQQVIEAMRHAKLYLDFGRFPGRERMPREAALCGCCLITSKIGSADYEEDFTHSYKFDSKDEHIWAIVNRIHYVLKNYETCRKDFKQFRVQLGVEKRVLPARIREVVNEIQRDYTGT